MISQHIANALNQYKEKGLNRVFTPFIKNPLQPSTVKYNGADVVNFCSNDYLRLSLNANVMEAMLSGVKRYGVGSGGTRNISGTTKPHVELEKAIARLHQKPSALVFSSAYNANVGALSVFGKKIPNLAFFSDEENHASIIHGINLSGAKKFVYRHNDLSHLEELLQTNTEFLPMIVCESVYSMSGTKTDLKHIEALAKKYKAMTYLDEVHAVGLYGGGAGVAKEQNAEIDIVNATLGKAFGCVGGYISASDEVCEFVKSFAGTFIFSTSLPPAICCAVLVAMEEAQKPETQKKFWKNVSYLKTVLESNGVSIVQTQSHIISIPVATAERVKKVASLLLSEHQIYIQPIFYPTVPLGKEMLRVTVSPSHNKEEMDSLVFALKKIGV